MSFKPKQRKTKIRHQKTPWSVLLFLVHYYYCYYYYYLLFSLLFLFISYPLDLNHQVSFVHHETRLRQALYRTFWRRVYADDPWEIWYYALKVVFYRTGHTREILECTKNKIPLSILLMPLLLSDNDKHETIFCVTEAHVSPVSRLNRISICIQPICFCFLISRFCSFVCFLNNYVFFFK